MIPQAVLLLAAGLCAQQGGVGADEALIHVLHDAFLANKSAFVQGRITFRYVKGSAESAEAARDGAFNPRYVAQGLYAFTPKSARFDRIFSEEEMRSTTTYTQNAMNTGLDSARVVTDGVLSLRESLTAKRTAGLVRNISLTAGTRAFDAVFRFPLGLGRLEDERPGNLSRLLRDVFKKAEGIRVDAVEPDVEFEGRRVVKLTLGLPNGTETFWVDLERGAVPLKLVDHVKEVDSVAADYHSVHLLDDLRQIPGRGWLPYRYTWWHSFDDAAGQIEILDASFDRPPRPDDFALTFSEPVAIANDAADLRYPARRTWSLANLPRPGSPGVERTMHVPIPLSEVPSMPGELEHSGRTELMISGFCMLIVTVALILWGSKRYHGAGD